MPTCEKCGGFYEPMDWERHKAFDCKSKTYETYYAPIYENPNIDLQLKKEEIVTIIVALNNYSTTFNRENESIDNLIDKLKKSIN